MDYNTLARIINSIEGFEITQENFDQLFIDTSKKITIDEEIVDKFLKFDYKKVNFVFRSGKISCTGIDIEFKGERFPDIYVSLGWTPFHHSFFNYILLCPKHTEKDWENRKRPITIKSTSIVNHKGLEQLIKKTMKRFECPIC